MRICPNCSASDLPDSARVCGHCGARLATPEPVALPPQPATRAVPPPPDPGWATIRFESNKKALAGYAGFKVRVDGEVIGRMGKGSSMVHRVRPGTIEVEVKRNALLGRWRSRTVQLGEGETADVRITFLRTGSGAWSLELRAIG